MTSKPRQAIVPKIGLSLLWEQACLSKNYGYSGHRSQKALKVLLKSHYCDKTGFLRR